VTAARRWRCYRSRAGRHGVGVSAVKALSDCRWQPDPVAFRRLRSVGRKLTPEGEDPAARSGVRGRRRIEGPDGSPRPSADGRQLEPTMLAADGLGKFCRLRGQGPMDDKRLLCLESCGADERWLTPGEVEAPAVGRHEDPRAQGCSAHPERLVEALVGGLLLRASRLCQADRAFG
jgi:hypothetical protein